MAMNVGLDLAAADMPLRPDPAVRTRRRPATVGRAAFESVLQDEGDDYNRALRAYVSELIASGMDPETANRVAVSRMVQNRMENIPEGAVADERTAAVGSGVELGINDPSALDLGGAGRPGPYDLAGRPGYDRTFTPQELAAQRATPAVPDAAGYTVPGPRRLDGRPARAPQPLATAEDVEAYNTRAKDPEGPFYLPSQRDGDMIRRGMVPVLNPDGTVGYSVLYPKDDATEGPQLPGAAGRLGLRPDLEAKGWLPTPVDSPLGMVNVYRPGEKAQQRYDAQAEQRSRRRIAESAGLSGAEAQSLTMGDLRGRAQAARIDDANARREAWKAQTMLAGGQPTGGRGGTKAVTNALMMLPEGERNQSLQYMLPGGQLAATVDANANQQAFELAKQMALGAGFQDPNSPAARAALQALEEKRRRENPEAAGVADLASGNPTSTEAQAEADRLAQSMDNDWGGFSYEAEMALAQRLQKPPYNMKQPEAEAAAHRAAEARRWWWNQGGSPQKPAAAGTSPSGWGAAPPQGPPGA